MLNKSMLIPTTYANLASCGKLRRADVLKFKNIPIDNYIKKREYHHNTHILKHILT